MWVQNIDQEEIMEEKGYGKERREKSSFGSNKDRNRRGRDENPRFKKDSESRDKQGKSEYPRKRRDSSEKPFRRDDSQSSRRFDRDNSGRKSRSEEPNRKYGRDSESRNRDNEDQSEYSDRRRSDSRGRSPRRFENDRSDRRHRSEDSRSKRDSDRSKRGENRSDFQDKKRRFADNSDESKDSKRSEYFENKPDKDTLQKKHYSKKKQLAFAKKEGPKDGILRLNKYISNTGACSRREADKRIEDGRITVNDKIVTEVGTKVNLTDDVCMDGKKLNPEAKVYLVLNKPKDFVTTLDDPMGRKTVLDLIKNACPERVYPVGRLDRMTTGILLFTNDGDLTKRLTHPSYEKKKIYHVFLDREITQEELDQIKNGIELEDGEIAADAISFADSEDKTQVGIEIHSGRNRIVRRIFEHFGYEVEKLDRVFFAGITKKNIPRGKWRFLSEKEVNMLKIY